MRPTVLFLVVGLNLNCVLFLPFFKCICHFTKAHCVELFEQVTFLVIFSKFKLSCLSGRTYLE